MSALDKKVGIGFRDRHHAGKLLGQLLRECGYRDPLVLGLPRGGIPVAFEAADALGAPLEPLLVRKLGVPGYPHLSMGAVAAGGSRVLNRDVVLSAGVSATEIEEETRRQMREIAAREGIYAPGRSHLPLERRTVILVDDGMATGATMRAALQALRADPAEPPEAIIVAVPVASRAAISALSADADETHCLLVREDFTALEEWYADFRRVSDDAVRTLCAAWHLA